MTPTRPAAVVVLAAGEGTRMKSATPKVLHTLCGRSLLGHVLTAGRALEPDHLVVVVGHGRDQVAGHVAEIHPAAQTVVQEEQLGTGHAVRVALDALGVLEGTVVVDYGDTPLLTAETLRNLVATHTREGRAATVLTANVPDSTGYGRIVRHPEGPLAAIVEERDATPEQRAITEINSGVYAFDGKLLADAVGRLSRDNAKGEEYLTDVLGMLHADGHRVGGLRVADHREILGINDRVQLAEARRVLNDRLLVAWMLAGVTIVDPATTWVDVGVALEPDATIHPNTRLHGGTRLAAGAEVGPNCTLTDTVVGTGARVRDATCVAAEIGPEASVGPYAYLRPGTRLGRRAKAGTYVEMKNADIGDGSKVPHLTYVGDATIGEHTNIGAATVFVNYDGVAKHHTVVGSHCRTGSDNMLVAPVEIGDGAYTGAGTVVRRDVPPGALAVSGGSQRNVEGWVERKRPGSAAARAAGQARERANGEAPGMSPGPEQEQTGGGGQGEESAT
ncbi:MAG: bifunctional UDP-N-acetylglucosamine diphosphorylase/glucosamine-1-phosphate N-acetyltransferase GlmU [Streptomycetales bacterium]